MWLLHLLAYGVPKVEGLKVCRLNHGINIIGRKVVERLDGSDRIDKLGPACSFPRIGKNFCMGIHQGEPMRKAYIYAQTNSIRDGYTSKNHQSDEVMIRAIVG